MRLDHFCRIYGALLRFQKDLCRHLSFSYRFRLSTLQRRIRLKRFYTLSAHAQMNSTYAHFNISAREIGAICCMIVCPPFWILTVEWSGARSVYLMTSPFSDSIVFSVHTRKQRFQKASFSNRSTLESVFEWFRFRRCSVDDSCIRSKTAPFSFENGLLWTGPN